VSGASPTLRQRELGLRLRRLRTGRGLTVEDVADKLLCSPAKISRIETAARRPGLRDVRDLCDLYGVDDVVKAELMQLTREARQQGWWSQYEDLNLNPYIGLEQEASAITHYAMHYVPALMQTEDYAREIIKKVLPGIDPRVLQDRVAARLRRQVGDSALMAAQLGKIIELVQAGKTSVVVIPFAAGAYPTSDSMFIVLEFSESLMPTVVYVEGLTTNQFHERSPDVMQYQEALEHQRDAALTPQRSLQRLEEMRKTYLGDT
jgi:transcriptional regulator with XRE-family HTH domain